jgi:hypothetical protein
MNIRLLGKVVGAALFSVALMACTINDKKLGEIEDSIKSTLKEKGVKMKSVSCPKGQKSTVGTKFDCTGETDEGHKLTFNVEVTGAGGAMKWELEGKILDLKKIESAVSKKLKDDAELECPEQSLVVKKGDIVDCTVEVGGKKQKLQIKTMDNEGNVEWKIKGAASGDDDDDDEKPAKKKKKADDDDDDD